MLIRTRKFLALTITDKLLFMEAAICLFLAKGLLVILPFRHCIKSFNNDKCIIVNPDYCLLERIRAAVRRASRLAFWKNVCLVQSFAGKWMLQRRKIPSDLYIGVNIDKSKKIIAHAWLKTGNFEITSGGGDFHKLHVL